MIFSKSMMQYMFYLFYGQKYYISMKETLQGKISKITNNDTTVHQNVFTLIKYHFTFLSMHNIYTVIKRLL